MAVGTSPQYRRYYAYARTTDSATLLSLFTNYGLAYSTGDSSIFGVLEYTFTTTEDIYNVMVANIRKYPGVVLSPEQKTDIYDLVKISDLIGDFTQLLPEMKVAYFVNGTITNTISILETISLASTNSGCYFRKYGLSATGASTGSCSWNFVSAAQLFYVPASSSVSEITALKFTATGATNKTLTNAVIASEHFEFDRLPYNHSSIGFVASDVSISAAAAANIFGSNFSNVSDFIEYAGGSSANLYSFQVRPTGLCGIGILFWASGNAVEQVLIQGSNDGSLWNTTATFVVGSAGYFTLRSTNTAYSYYRVYRYAPIGLIGTVRLLKIICFPTS